MTRKRIPGRLDMRALAVLTARCNRTRLNQLPAVGSESVAVHGHGPGFNQQPGNTTKGGGSNLYKAKGRPTS